MWEPLAPVPYNGDPVVERRSPIVDHLLTLTPKALATAEAFISLFTA